jgi:hypothetical protein
MQDVCQKDSMGKLTWQPRLSLPDSSEQITGGCDNGINMADDKRSISWTIKFTNTENLLHNKHWVYKISVLQQNIFQSLFVH